MSPPELITVTAFDLGVSEEPVWSMILVVINSLVVPLVILRGTRLCRRKNAGRHPIGITIWRHCFLPVNHAKAPGCAVGDHADRFYLNSIELEQRENMKWARSVRGRLVVTYGRSRPPSTAFGKASGVVTLAPLRPAPMQLKVSLHHNTASQQGWGLHRDCN